MTSDLPAEYTERDLQNARTKGQIVGWIQGGAVGIGGFMVVGMLGWIPTIAVVGVGGYVLYKVLAAPKRAPSDES